MDIKQTLQRMAELSASDLHLTADSPPAYRIHGQLRLDEEAQPLTPAELAEGLAQLLNEHQRKAFLGNLELDFAIDLKGVGRFRGNAALERGRVSLVIRRVTELASSIETLGLPPVCKALAMKPRGLVVVTGPTGSGKSTTLAAMIEHLNQQGSWRIVTIEDPIEYVFKNKKSIITQRQVGTDTKSFATGLTQVLRQNPNVIMVGEMRDVETAAAALSAAETGHLVLATSHAPSAPQTIDRLVGLFPPHNHGQVRAQIASILEGVICQQLLPRADKKGLVAAVEVMLGATAIRHLIREGKVHQIYAAMQSAAAQGMQTMDKALAELTISGAITEETALAYAESPEQVQELVRSGRPRGAEALLTRRLP